MGHKTTDGLGSSYSAVQAELKDRRAKLEQERMQAFKQAEIGRALHKSFYDLLKAVGYVDFRTVGADDKVVSKAFLHASGTLSSGEKIIVFQDEVQEAPRHSTFTLSIEGHESIVVGGLGMFDENGEMLDLDDGERDEWAEMISGLGDPEVVAWDRDFDHRPIQEFKSYPFETDNLFLPPISYSGQLELSLTTDSGSSPGV